jgi:PADRE domain
MGNSIGGKKRTAKVMKVDGTAFRLKPPVQVADVLRDHPGYNLLDAEEVKQLGVRANPLSPDDNLKSGKLYFLVELPKLPDKRTARRAWSGTLQVGAKEWLESLMLTRRSTSDLSYGMSSSVDEESDGALRLRMRLPKKEVARLMEESKDPRETAQKIMELCKAAGTPVETPMTTPTRSPLRSPMINPVMTPRKSPLRSALVTPLKTPTRTPERWPSLSRTPELRTPRTPDVKEVCFL